MSNIDICGNCNVSNVIINSDYSTINEDKYLLLNHCSQPRDTNSG